MSFRPALIVLSVLALAGCGNPDTPAGRAADQRHEDFEAIGEAMKTAGDELKAAAPDMVKITAAAATINGFAPKIPSWFPAGSGPQDGIKTDALAAVWTDAAGFAAAADKFKGAALAFDVAAQTGNKAAIGAAMQALGGACKGCHDKFREAD
jgi:cytochrome c556